MRDVNLFPAFNFCLPDNDVMPKTEYRVLLQLYHGQGHKYKLTSLNRQN